MPLVLPRVVDADFVTEARDVAGLPPPGPPIVAISGRSNVGKSTLLNRLAARKQLARTSKTPGRTRGVIVYDLAVETDEMARTPVRLIDLPGFGYARVGRSEKLGWGPMVEGFVTESQDLRLILVLIDGRRDPSDEERQLIAWLQHLGVPYRLVATKADQLTAGERGLLPQRLGKAFGVKVPIIPVSGRTGFGIERLWQVVLQSLFPEDRAT